MSGEIPVVHEIDRELHDRLVTRAEKIGLTRDELFNRYLTTWLDAGSPGYVEGMGLSEKLDLAIIQGLNKHH